MSPALDFLDWGCFCLLPLPLLLDGEGEPSRCGRSRRSSSAEESTAEGGSGGGGGGAAAALPPLLLPLLLLDFPLPLFLAFLVERATDGERVARGPPVFFFFFERGRKREREREEG